MSPPYTARSNVAIRASHKYCHTILLQMRHVEMQTQVVLHCARTTPTPPKQVSCYIHKPDKGWYTEQHDAFSLANGRGTGG